MSMNQRLIYVVGPSGAGKDSLLAWLRERLPVSLPVHWVRRTITRPAHAGGEDHESVDAPTFEAALQAGGFALHWEANGLKYGIRQQELVPLANKHWVMLNGSRAHLEACCARYPGLSVLHITADTHILRSRLRQRGRESVEAIEARLQRFVNLAAPADSKLMEVRNNTSLDVAGHRLLLELERLPGWPADTSVLSPE